MLLLSGCYTGLDHLRRRGRNKKMYVATAIETSTLLRSPSRLRRSLTPPKHPGRCALAYLARVPFVRISQGPMGKGPYEMALVGGAPCDEGSCAWVNSSATKATDEMLLVTPCPCTRHGCVALRCDPHPTTSRHEASKPCSPPSCDWVSPPSHLRSTLPF